MRLFSNSYSIVGYQYTYQDGILPDLIVLFKDVGFKFTDDYLHEGIKDIVRLTWLAKLYLKFITPKGIYDAI